MKTKPMTGVELERRLKAGEKPLDLARDKWRRLAHADVWGRIGAKGDVWLCDNCALCDVYEDCCRCPLDKAGFNCDEVNSPFARACRHGYGENRRGFLAACKAMQKAFDKAEEYV